MGSRRRAAARLHDVLGRALLWCGWSRGASQAFRDALVVEPGSPDLQVRLGESLLRGGRHEEACEALARAAALRPSDADVQGMLVVALVRGGRGSQAIDALRRLVDLRPGQAELHVLLGALLRRHHRAQESIRSFRWAVRLRLEPRRFVLGEDVLGEEGWASVLQSSRLAAELPPGQPNDSQRSGTPLHAAPVAGGAGSRRYPSR